MIYRSHRLQGEKQEKYRRKIERSREKGEKLYCEKVIKGLRVDKNAIIIIIIIIISSFLLSSLY